MSECFSDNLEDLAGVIFIILYIFDRVDKRGIMIGFDFKSIDEILKGCILISGFQIDHTQEMIDIIGIVIDLDVFLTNLLGFFVTVRLDVD